MHERWQLYEPVEMPRPALGEQSPTDDTHAGLRNAISAPRFAAYLDAAGGDAARARKLYVWNRDVSAAVLADIAILEVALRNAMHAAASDRWGTHWYANPEFQLDDRGANQLSKAWNYLPTRAQREPNRADVPGRVVANCMFGFWVNLLDQGATFGRAPRTVSVNYDLQWDNAFKRAFPGGRIEAKNERDRRLEALPKATDRERETQRLRQELAFTRSWVHSVCKTVNDLRNRVAHHEPLINGFPLNGRNRRLSAFEGHEHCRQLARMLDRDLADWLDSHTKVPALLADRP